MTWWQGQRPVAAPPPTGDTGADRLVVPRISFPVPARLHPAADELEERTLAWLRDFDIISSDAEEAYLRHYQEDWKQWLHDLKATWTPPTTDLAASLRDWWEPLLRMAPMAMWFLRRSTSSSSLARKWL